MKSKKLIEFENAWNAITLMHLFEIEVYDKRTCETAYVIFDITIDGQSFKAQHESLNTKQEKSKKIAFVKVPIDTDFSIDRNLEELLSACESALFESEFFGYPIETV